MSGILNATSLIFGATVLATFALTVIARRHGAKLENDALSAQGLNKWLVGLSAGATANSGFIVTAAVGLGYMYGTQWLLLPIAWLLGDILFWSLFPHRLNERGRLIGARTITDLVVHETEAKTNKLVSVVVATLIVVGLSGYTAAQWLAGQKFMAGAFDLAGTTSLTLFAGVIVAYTAIGGFRGSIYADSFMAVLRLIGTFVALLAIILVIREDQATFRENIVAASPDFLNVFAMGGAATIIGFMVGFAAASLGFGLGQPQIVSRYLAGKSSSETRASWWIYIGFVQVTWLAMTAFGVLLRGVMPDVSDPESGLSLFFRSYYGPIITGIIVADIFATIAATSNSLLLSMAQSLKHDLLEKFWPSLAGLPLWPLTLGLGLLTMVGSLFADTSVLTLAVTSVSILGSGIAPVLITKLLSFRNNSYSTVASLFSGVITASLWFSFGLGSLVNEAAPGICVGLLVNYLVAKLTTAKGTGEHETDA